MRTSEFLFGESGGILEERDFQALLVAGTLVPLGSGIVSPILDSLIGPLGASPGDIGLVISVFTAPAIVFIPIGGLLSDRYGRRSILLPGVLLFGVAGMAIAFTTDFRVVLALRTLQGIGFAGIGPVIITSLGDIYEGTVEATAQGIRFTTSSTSQIVFPLLAGALVGVAWQYPFLLYGLTVPIALFVYRYLDEPSDGTARATADGDPFNLGALRRLLGEPRVFAMVVARGLPMVLWIGFITYNSIVVVRFLEASPTAAGVLVAIASVAMAVAASQAGRLTARFDSRLNSLVVANLVMGAGFAAFVFAPSLPVAGVGVAALGGGMGLVMSVYRSVLTGLATESLRGGLVSVAEAFGRVMSTATPVVMGAVIAFGTPRVGLLSAVQLAGVLATVVGSGGGVVCLLIARAAPAPSETA